MYLKQKLLIISIGIICPVLMIAQPSLNKKSYDISKDKVLYTIGYSHLDSEWNWDYPATINEYIKNIMTENFYLFEKYPDYVFNFTGSRRYQMMKEYYPDLYEKVKQYIKQGRWRVSGSSVDEGEVNMSSSEALIRQVLYGNNYFRKEFGTESYDYMLPDCFGFLANVPSIWNHCGLLGFSTQKLTWRSAVGVPFNVGVWNGPDGKGIIAALNAQTYTGTVEPRLDLSEYWNKRIDENMSKYGFSFDYRYYGVGDQGGAPRERDVKNAVGSLSHGDSKFKILLTSSDQIYKDITPEIRKKLPTYSGDLLLIEHSAGSLTSQAFMKRMNRKNELLAQSAEQVASIADWMGGINYPFTKLNNSWDLVLGSQFHDILPGTSIPKAYDYAWNDEFIAANGFAEVLKSSVGVIAGNIDTRGTGRSVVVYNPVAAAREDVVTAELTYDKLPAAIQVVDQKGKTVPSQILESNGNKLKFIFLAKIPSVGLASFDVRESKAGSGASKSLSVTASSLENEYYKVSIASNGDITSIFDKKVGKELLAKPAQLEFLSEEPAEWPAWNMDWKDRQKPAIDVMDKEASIRILEQGPVRVSLEVKRKGRNSEISQSISLSAGEAGKRVEVANKIDWQSKGVCLKASFPLTAANEKATYNLGVGTLQRTNNNEVKFEVPSKEWFDLTDKSGSYGVSILEDCKYGSDKPSDNTLRLTLLYTPKARSFAYQGSQDWGIHDVKYGIYGHKGDWNAGQTPLQGKFLNQPLIAFETSRHEGKLGREISLLSFNTPQVGLMAFKKMEQGDYYLVRVNELFGKDLKGASVKFPGNIIDAYEVNGQEQKIGSANFAGNSLNFDLTYYTMRSFAVKFATPAVSSAKIAQVQVELPFNQDVMSFDKNRNDGEFGRRSSLPAELIPDQIESEGIVFKMGDKTDETNNAVKCDKQVISLPAGDFNKVYILAAANDNVSDNFVVDNQPFRLDIQSWTGYIGQFYGRRFGVDQVEVIGVNEPFVKTSNIAWYASHCHNAYPSKNDAYRYGYLYKYEINLPKNAKTITLPGNNRIKVLAITAAKVENTDVKTLEPLYDDFSGNKPFQFRKE